ncbi:flavodoxin [Bordetella ansorpii]|uniref:Flavodoxin n=1 Tax=Bordetella ansorpii TaxID=288768 RepID=A0A157ST43_9BORD|nr:NAD(P)H-dependent oxidoreductase [Bordetella ansorpii]SAI73658.1 flavodoxin [Bordetella ansorpii]
MKTLLIVWHSRTGAARAMAAALERGARHAARELDAAPHLAVVRRRAGRAQPGDVLKADGYLFCAPENLGTLSGEMKEFFDRAYYPALDRIAGRPYGLAISAGTDGSGAARQAERICTGWRLRAVAPALVARNGAQTPEAIMAAKTVPAAVLAQCEELGGLLAATLLAGL